MIKKHWIVIKDHQGTPQPYQLKEWLRANPNEVPTGLDANDSTTYQLKRGLKKIGWEIEELSDRVLVINHGQVLEEIRLGRRETHDAAPLISHLARLGL